MLLEVNKNSGAIKRMALLKKKKFKDYKPMEKLKKTQPVIDPSDVG
jgi:hypothetical protein